MSDPIFETPTNNPFGIANVGSFAAPTLVDIDGDGDLDAFVGNNTGNTLFFRNTGTITNPLFAVATNNPFGLEDVGIVAAPTLVDIDEDGDLDAFVGNSDGNTLFFRNTGTITNPLFAVATANPFGLADVGTYAKPTFVDIDGDGDLDALVGNSDGNTLFFRNTGTITNPLFAVATANPFGLADVGTYSTPTLVDIDGDGDLDAFIGRNIFSDSPFGPLISGNTLFFRNTGTTTNPLFSAATIDPFYLTDVGIYAKPTFVDIDGDGDLDAFVGNRNGNTQFFRNNNIEITQARYNINTGTLVVTGSRFLSLAGTNNDIDVSKLTIKGQGGATYTLTSANVDITSSKSFTITLNAADKSVISTILNKKGSQSSGGNTYNLAAAAGWAAGAPVPARITNLTNGLRAIADPIFETATTDPFGLTDVGSFVAPTFVDIDGDGDLDAFVGNSDGNTLFFRNTGTITNPLFAVATNNPFGLVDVGFVATPTFVDIDGDGDLDALVGNFDGNTLFFRNTGTITNPLFAVATANPFGLADVGTYAKPTFVDIDGDGDLDAFVGNQAGNTLFFKNMGTITSPIFAAATTNPFGLVDVGYNASPTLVDIDGDGDLDAFVGNFDGDTLFFRNTGTITNPIFAAATTNPFGLADVGIQAKPTFVDIDGDGNLDALVGNSFGNTVFYRDTLLRSVRTDFNGDRKSDILWRKDDGTVALWKMDGATVVSGSYVTPTLGNSWKVSSTGDFDGDGKADILWRNDDGTVALWQMNGATVTTGSYLTPTLDSSWKVASTGDFDGDKKADILWRNNDGTTALWKMDGATVVSGNYLTAALDSSWKVASTGDFDGDKKTDILWRKDDGTTALWKMDGATVVSGSYVTPTLGNSWKVASTGDFDGDGKADILWRNDDGTTALWKMDGATVVSGNYLTAALDSGWKVAGTADFNGDGKADILWRNDNGTTAEWQMNGATVVAGNYLAPALDNSWQIAAPIL